MDARPVTGAAPAAPILLEGADVLPLLHRISTQRLDDLEPGAARMTLFCDLRGRMLHRAAVARTVTGVWLIRADAPAEPLAAHVDKHVFRDRVRVSDPPPGWTVRAVPKGFGLPVGTVEDREGIPVRIQVETSFGLGLEPADVKAATNARTEDEIARIDAGWPRHGHEVVADFTPFDIGRAHEVHLAKGCYTGQESLLRLVTYGGVRHGLARVEGDGAAPEAPDSLSADGRQVGRLTSAAARGSGWIGLAVLRREVIASGVDVSTGAGRPARVVALPDAGPLGIPG